MRTRIAYTIGQPVRAAALEIRRAGRRLRYRQFMEPTFVIIGAQKAATSSLYRYLTAHPEVVPAVTKEVHYFDWHFNRGRRWYASNFPPVGQDTLATNFVTGESSPYYLAHPLAAKRMAAELPAARLIVLLRNPVSRAFSHYRHEVRRNFEKLPFLDALRSETARLRGAEDALAREAVERSYPHEHYSYLHRGLYARQLATWFEHFPRSRFLILRTEDLESRPGDVLSQVWAHLGLQAHEPPDLVRHNVGTGVGIGEREEAYLKNYFEGPNRSLQQLIGKEFSWPD